MEAVIPNPKLKLLDQVREVMRLKRYSIRTERCYSDWVRRYVRFHRMRSREDLAGAERKIELFLSDLAVNGQVTASTQNHAFGARKQGTSNLESRISNLEHRTSNIEHRTSNAPAAPVSKSQIADSKQMDLGTPWKASLPAAGGSGVKSPLDGL